MKIFDCFTYFDEDLILDLRFNILNNYVEKFIIIECGEDHHGNKKKKNFNINNFKKFEDKIIYIFIDNFGSLNNSWKREHFQRNYIQKALDVAGPEDMILISDADEIPNLQGLNFDTLNEFKYLVFEQNLFYYKLNLILDNNLPWHGTKGCKKKYLKSPQWLRSAKAHKTYPFWRFDKINFKKIHNGGWHFSYLKKPIDIQQKIRSFAHTEFDEEKFFNLNNIEASIKQKKDLFHRGYSFKKVELDKNFPDYILKNKNKLEEWII